MVVVVTSADVMVCLHMTSQILMCEIICDVATSVGNYKEDDRSATGKSEKRQKNHHPGGGGGGAFRRDKTGADW